MTKVSQHNLHHRIEKSNQNILLHSFFYILCVSVQVGCFKNIFQITIDGV